MGYGKGNVSRQKRRRLKAIGVRAQHSLVSHLRENQRAAVLWSRLENTRQGSGYVVPAVP